MPEPRALLVCQPFFLFSRAGYYAPHHQGDAICGKDDPGGRRVNFMSVALECDKGHLRQRAQRCH